MKNKLVVKYNGGNPVILCSSCSVILKYWNDFTQEEKDFVNKGGGQAKYWQPQAFCPKCTKAVIQHVK